MTTLAMVGNAKQPFYRLLDAVRIISSTLPQPVIVQHGNTPFDDPACVCHAFMDRETVSELMAKSELIICHAGAGTVIEAVRAGRVPVVMPRKRAFGEHVDDHQIEFAAMLRQTQKAVVIEEPELLEYAVGQALAIHRQPKSEPVEPLLVGLIRDVLRATLLEREAKRRTRNQPQ